MSYTQEEKSMLENVNKIGIEITSSDNDFIFIRLSPYLDNLMAFLRRLNSTEISPDILSGLVFAVMIVLSMDL